jgi:hypothetical protein
MRDWDWLDVFVGSCMAVAMLTLSVMMIYQMVVCGCD